LAALSQKDIDLQGTNVQKQILSSEVYSKSRYVGVYLSMGKELPTQLILNDLLRPDSGKVCFIPFIDNSQNKIKMLKVNSEADIKENFKPNKWGILEPINHDQRENALDAKTLDLLIVPGLAFSLRGARCGRGKGYYDRFIEESETVMVNVGLPPPITLGVGFSCQEVEDIPMMPTDKYLNKVLFPHRD